MLASDVIREVRRVGGFTQRALAERAGTTQSAIAAYESGSKSPTTSTLERIVRAGGVDLAWSLSATTPREYRPMTLADLSHHLAGASSDAEQRRFVLEFLEEYGWEPIGSRRALLETEPDPTGDARSDALLAALAEHLAYHDGATIPHWAEEPNRFLDRWWFPVNLPSARVAALVGAPASFRRRGVFIDRRDLERA